MGLIIGIDEAGYGPNLGPLLVGASAWEVPGDPREFDFWNAFDGIVSQNPSVDGSRIQIADSKVVYTPAKGLHDLEWSMQHALEFLRVSLPETVADSDSIIRSPIRSFRQLVAAVALPAPDPLESEPWFANADWPLAEVPTAPLLQAWQERCRSGAICLKSLKADVVLTRRFNELTAARDSKGRALSEISMNLIRQVWDECRGESYDRVLILADKHGGRNRYQEFLPIIFEDRFVRCLRETAESSRYAVGNAEVRFETKSERHLPVALASMLCKYLRELSMHIFNRFWGERQPGLKPTAGYPQDARRFKSEILSLQQQLGISDEILWRNR